MACNSKSVPGLRTSSISEQQKQQQKDRMSVFSFLSFHWLAKKSIGTETFYARSAIKVVISLYEILVYIVYTIDNTILFHKRVVARD